MPVRTRMTVKRTLTVADLDIEFDLEFSADINAEPIVRELPGGGYVVGYLSHDDDPLHPLNDCDGQGQIADAREYRATWEEHTSGEAKRGYLRLEARGGHIYHEPLAVMLDVYSHGNDCWRITGGGRYFPDEQWDVSHCAGVWWPDPCCEEHIYLTAGAEYFNAEESWFEERRIWLQSRSVKTPPLRDKPKLPIDITFKSHHADAKWWTTYGWRLQEGDVKRRNYKTVLNAVKGCCRHLKQPFDQEQWDCVVRKEVELCAYQAVEEYNKYLAGDAWAVCVETFDAEGNKLTEDACWSHIGEAWAQQELEETMAYHLKGKQDA